MPANLHMAGPSPIEVGVARQVNGGLVILQDGNSSPGASTGVRQEASDPLDDLAALMSLHDSLSQDDWATSFCR